MKSNVSKKAYCNQMSLSYDCLFPEEAFKLLECLWSDELCEKLQYCETDLSYGPTGYRLDDGKKIWSRDLVLFIETERISEEEPAEIVKQFLHEDQMLLEEIRDYIKEHTGID